MFLWRVVKWLFVLVLVIVAFVGFGLPLMANTEQGRNQLAEVLGRSLDRDVAVGELDVGWFFSSVDVGGLRIDNPEGFPEGAFLKAGRLSFDAKLANLFDGKVEGGLEGSGLDVHVIRKGGRTNLDGLGSGGTPEKQEGSGEAPDLDLALSLSNSRLTIEDLDKNEKLVLEGVGLEMRLTNDAGAKGASLRIRIDSIDRDELSVRDLEIDARADGDWLELEKLGALLPGKGRLTGSGRLQVRGGDAWQVKLDADRVGIDDSMRPIVAGLMPLAASAGGQLAGTLQAGFELQGHGLTWEAMKPTLDGTGKVVLSDLRLPAGSLLAQAAALAGRAGRGAIDLNSAGAEFAVGKGWLSFHRLSASGDKVRYDLAGRVSLDGRLDLSMDLMPLVKVFGGGKVYGKLARHVKQIPLRIGGTTLSPKLKPPSEKDLLKGVAGRLLEKGLGRLGGR